MQGPQVNPVPGEGCARAVLEWAQRVLLGTPLAAEGVGELLDGLVSACAASGAGIASSTGQTIRRHGPDGPSPAEEDPTLAARAWVAAKALVVRRSAGGTLLVTAFGQPGTAAGWVLWVEEPQRDWSPEEAGALAVAGLALGRRLASEEARPRWAVQLERAARQQGLEAIALVVRRLAHDFGNVLTGILGFSELGLAQALPTGSTLHSYLTEVHRGAQNGALLTHQLRQFARRAPLKPSPSSLVRILSEELRRFGSHFEVRLDLPTDPPPVVMEAEQLRQLVNILLTNAREALLGPGRVEVSARVRTLTEDDCLDYYGNLRPGVHLELSVADNGPGLSPEAQRSLFVEPFFTTKPRRRGLGLMLTYGVMHAHGGGLTLESTAGSGTLVRLMLPIASTVPASALDPVLGPDRGERILVVDEDVLALRFIRTTLEGAGYRVTALAGVAEAQTAYQSAVKDPYSLVLADLSLPEGGGFGLACRLFKEDAAARVLFLMAGHAGELHADRPGLAAGVLTKPFRPETLLRAVREALGGSTGADSGAGAAPLSCNRS